MASEESLRGLIGSKLASGQLVMECIGEHYPKTLQFHVRCFYIWVQSDERGTSRPVPRLRLTSLSATLLGASHAPATPHATGFPSAERISSSRAYQVTRTGTLDGSSLDNFVGSHEQRLRNRETKCLRRLEVDH